METPIGPFLAKGHPLQSGRSASSLKTEQVADLAHFLHQKVYNTLRTGTELQIQNVLTGDPKAGEVYFNGAGKCHTCHSPTGDLKGIGRKYDPPTLQSKFLFPRAVGFGRARSGAGYHEARYSDGYPVERRGGGRSAPNAG